MDSPHLPLDLRVMLFDFTTVSPESVSQVADDAIAQGDEIVARVLAVDGARTFANTVQPLEHIGSIGVIAYGRGPFLGHVSVNDDVRDAGRVAEERIQKWALDLVARRDVYEAVAGFADTEEAASLTGEKARVLAHGLRDFAMAGHGLSQEDRERVQELRSRLVEIEIAFNTNVAEFDDGIEVGPDDLEGLPDDYISRLAPGSAENTSRISMAYPDVVPFLDNSPRRDLREALTFKFNNRAVETNTPLLAEALETRAAIAGIFGLPSWAHYSMQVKMAEPET